MAKTKARRNKVGNVSIILGTIGVLVVLTVAYVGYKRFYQPNVHTEQQQGQKFLYIHTGAKFEQVISALEQCNCISDLKSFEWLAVKMDYPSHVKPGKYQLKNGMNNRELLKMLRAGRQAPVKLVVRNRRFKRDLIQDIAKQLEADTTSLTKLLNDDLFLSNYGFNAKTVPAIFIPNTYEIYWNTSAKQFVERMAKEYKLFWNENRMKRCAKIGMGQVEVSILASIIEEETQKNDEKRVIAGVYINRLNKDMLLQADPTVRYAWGDFSIKRILGKYLTVNSPYNTYKYKGLPPGPICIPSISTIDAVLNYQKHNYIYFCAKEDFSGYHNFAQTQEQHLRNAHIYQQALNRAGIMK
ncbi:MAG: endolytic transglycosylase MltG [Bacteroidota bacterium]|nr:endolytic transglycosylase MltG [Bacteroidota bacterium]